MDEVALQGGGLAACGMGPSGELESSLERRRKVCFSTASPLPLLKQRARECPKQLKDKILVHRISLKMLEHGRNPSKF